MWLCNIVNYQWFFYSDLRRCREKLVFLITNFSIGVSIVYRIARSISGG